MGPNSKAPNDLSAVPPLGSAIAIGDDQQRLPSALDGIRQQAAADQAKAQLREALIASHMPMAARLARTFAGRGEDLDDLTQAAMLALVKAVSNFDAARGVPFALYAYPCIVGGLKKHFRDTGWSLHVSRKMQELHLQTNRAIPALTQILSRHPTVADLAVYLQLTEQDVRDGLHSQLAYTTRSLNLPVGQDGEIGHLFGGPDADLEAVPDRHALRQHVACLPAREQTILRLRFDDGLTQREIAQRLGVSQMHVSRLLSRSLQLLRAMFFAQD